MSIITRLDGNLQSQNFPAVKLPDPHYIGDDGSEEEGGPYNCIYSGTTRYLIPALPETPSRPGLGK